MRLLFVVPALLLAGCAAPARTPSPTITPQPAVVTVTPKPTLVTVPTRTVVPTSPPTATAGLSARPTSTLPSLVDAPVFPYASEVGSSELPPKVPFRLVSVEKSGSRWQLYVDAPLATDAAHAFRVALDATNQAFAAPGAPRVVTFGIYSKDPSKLLNRLKTPVALTTSSEIKAMDGLDPDVAEGFASSDRRGFSGDGTWEALSFYGFTTPFGNGPFRDEGKIYVAIPRNEWASVDLFAIDRQP